MKNTQVLQVLKANGIRHRAVAQKIGMQETDFSNWLHGRKKMNAKQTEALRAFLATVHPVQRDASSVESKQFRAEMITLFSDIRAELKKISSVLTEVVNEK